jgi:hypothetical protein
MAPAFSPLGPRPSRPRSRAPHCEPGISESPPRLTRGRAYSTARRLRTTGFAQAPRSTVDFRKLIADRRIVLINLNAFDVGEDVAALVGGTVVNLAARAISAQATLPPERRQPVTLVVDEFQSIPGADYEQVLGELPKYGANMIIATQTLSRLDRLTDAQRTRDLRATVFSNLNGLFAFHTSAEDAAYLSDELVGPHRIGHLPRRSADRCIEPRGRGSAVRRVVRDQYSRVVADGRGLSHRGNRIRCRCRRRRGKPEGRHRISSSRLRGLTVAANPERSERGADSLWRRSADRFASDRAAGL